MKDLKINFYLPDDRFQPKIEQEEYKWKRKVVLEFPAASRCKPDKNDWWSNWDLGPKIWKWWIVVEDDDYLGVQIEHLHMKSKTNCTNWKKKKDIYIYVNGWWFFKKVVFNWIGFWIVSCYCYLHLRWNSWGGKLSVLSNHTRGLWFQSWLVESVIEKHKLKTNSCDNNLVSDSIKPAKLCMN